MPSLSRTVSSGGARPIAPRALLQCVGSLCVIEQQVLPSSLPVRAPHRSDRIGRDHVSAQIRCSSCRRRSTRAGRGHRRAGDRATRSIVGGGHPPGSRHLAPGCLAAGTPCRILRISPSREPPPLERDASRAGISVAAAPRAEVGRRSDSRARSSSARRRRWARSSRSRSLGR